MSQQELLVRVVQALNSSEIAYMITGSVASSLQGEPRSTHDIDVVVLMAPADVHKLVRLFPSPDYFLDEESARESLVSGSMFNLLAVYEGDKVDFWPLTDEPFDQSRFQRRYTENIAGVKVEVSSPEDTILAKLNWAQLSGGSQKQFVDALRIFETQYDELDMPYLEQWVARMNLQSLWNELKVQAEII